METEGTNAWNFTVSFVPNDTMLPSSSCAKTLNVTDSPAGDQSPNPVAIDIAALVVLGFTDKAKGDPWISEPEALLTRI
jgi:hypothetical protein